MGSRASHWDALRRPLANNGAADFSSPIVFDLEKQKPRKTVDIGCNGVSLSLDAFGRILQASTLHHVHGIVVAVPFEQFDGDRFHDPSYVRVYRTRMLQCIQEDRGGFGLDLRPENQQVSIDITQANTAIYHFQLAKTFQISVTVNIAEDGEFTQVAEVANCGLVPATLPYFVNFGVSLNRASYGQLTEGGPLPLPQSHNQLRKDDRHTLKARNPQLGAQLRGSLTIGGNPVDLSGVHDQEALGAPLDAHFASTCIVQPGSALILHTVFRLNSDCDKFDKLSGVHLPIRTREATHGFDDWRHNHAITTYILKRNLHYILANCVVPINDTIAAIVTDHVALPLGWNRDNYWQIRLLHETHANLHHLVYPDTASQYAKQIQYATRGHLTWVFSHAQRPRGYWHRSYLVTGRPKDLFVYQLDQQCYPLLELCDYLDYFPDEIDFVKRITNSGAVQEVLELLLLKKDTDTGLWPTDETPGDDAVVYPYHFSSHVLLWRTLTRLVQLFQHIDSPYVARTRRLETEAEHLRGRTINSFTSQHPESGKMIFAYLIDGEGQHTFYHDANDVPTLLASEWGFVSTSDELSTWANTMDFGISPVNKDAYCGDGPYGGLGSVHSPGAWALGYFQELSYAAYSRDTRAMRSAWAKVTAAMQWDGTFSEAVDPKTAACTSKAWFSWPGAMIGALIIRMKADGQEQVLLENNEAR